MLSWLPRDPLPLGSKAPDFTLSTESGKKVTLSALRGKNVVLVFYPGDDTLICRQQLCEFRDAWPDMRAHHVAAFGINQSRAWPQSRTASRLPRYSLSCSPSSIAAAARVIFRVTKVSPRVGPS